ncbi:hypothetical protein DSO57_1016768 [Entomophthora muscae]|uniref:Uncharacterized protein n=1 Tax=Entomophthora muscae TaxID=34485 RepID=A0ACC2T4W1_9FUNG|nr:hypothetical protein DSO57_1016768 [Entomophthora muscae]
MLLEKYSMLNMILHVRSNISVRNIPDINQITTGGQVWKRKGVFLFKKAKFNEDFPPLIGGNKNQTGEETEFNSCWNNLISRQAPATPASTLCQTSGTQPAASRPPANPLLACQTTTSQPDACKPPASHLLAHPAASRPAASSQSTHFLPRSPSTANHPPESQALTHSQSEALITCSQ